MLASAILSVALLATPPGDQAQTLYRAGSQAYQVGKYSIAIDAFEATRAISDRPLVIFSLAQAYRLRFFQNGNLADLEAATKAYRAFVATGPQGTRRIHATQHLSTLVPYLERSRIDAGHSRAQSKARLIVTSKIADAVAQIGDSEPQPVPATFEVEPGTHTVTVTAPLHLPLSREAVAVAAGVVGVALDPDPIPGRLKLTLPKGIRVTVDSVDRGQTPLDTPISLAPGPHELILRAMGRQPQVEAFNLAPGQTLAFDLTLERTMQRSVAWTLMGTAGALAIGAGVTGFLSLEAQSEAEALEAQLGTGFTNDGFFDQHAALKDDRDDYLNATIGLGLAASTALVTGVLLYAFDDPAPPFRRSRNSGPLAQAR